MAKLTLKKIAENTLRKVGRPLTTKEIWEEANRIGTVEDFVSSGKTPLSPLLVLSPASRIFGLEQKDQDA